MKKDALLGSISAAIVLLILALAAIIFLSWYPCSGCDGKGMLEFYISNPGGYNEQLKCQKCGGRGQISIYRKWKPAKLSTEIEQW